MLYAVIAASSVARGRVTALDVEAAKAHPGVVEVMTPANRPPLAHDPDVKMPPFGFRVEVLQAIPCATRPADRARARRNAGGGDRSAALLNPQYSVEPARTSLETGDLYNPASVGVGAPARTKRGDLEAGFAAATHVTESTYATPPQYHNAMEPPRGSGGMGRRPSDARHCPIRRWR